MITRTIKPSELTDEHTLVECLSRWDNPIYFWDDSYGPLWVYRESLGIRGIVRAPTWEDAYSCVEDEILDDEDPDNWSIEERQEHEDSGELPEGVSYRSNGVPSNPNRHSALCSYDLNGNALDKLTDELATELEITVKVQGCMFTVTKYYEIWDEEALEAGETDDKGTDYEDEPTSLRDIVALLQGTEASDSRYGAGSWFTTIYEDINYRTGERTYHAYFLKINGHNLSAHQIRRIAKAAKLRKAD